MVDDIAQLLASSTRPCSCGRYHSSDVQEVIIGSQALASIAPLVIKYSGTNVFLIADQATFDVAGNKVCAALAQAQIGYKCHIFQEDGLELDNVAVGEVILNYDSHCDLIIGVGSGTIGDLGKIVAGVTGKAYIMVATAPSMDGFASSTSSVVLNRTKVSINSSAPTAILADLDILCQAPMSLIKAGLGDMLAKYISICEWRISNLVTDEYYCEEIASLVRKAVRACVQSVEGLRERKAESVELLCKSLVISGLAMSFAGLSRPASGVEHYFSHIWDMRAIEYGTHAHFHGIQCGIATFFSLKIYDLVTKVIPHRQQALDYVKTFSLERWNEQLTDFLGKSARALIEKEEQEGKYNQAKHSQRLERIILNWDGILQIISEELPRDEELLAVLKRMDLPSTPSQLGLSPEVVRDTFMVTKDIRDKYVASRLLWDLGVIDEIGEQLLKALSFDEH